MPPQFRKRSLSDVESPIEEVIAIKKRRKDEDEITLPEDTAGVSNRLSHQIDNDIHLRLPASSVQSDPQSDPLLRTTVSVVRKIDINGDQHSQDVHPNLKERDRPPLIVERRNQVSSATANDDVCSHKKTNDSQGSWSNPSDCMAQPKDFSESNGESSPVSESVVSSSDPKKTEPHKPMQYLVLASVLSMLLVGPGVLISSRNSFWHTQKRLTQNRFIQENVHNIMTNFTSQDRDQSLLSSHLIPWKSLSAYQHTARQDKGEPHLPLASGETFRSFHSHESRILSQVLGIRLAAVTCKDALLRSYEIQLIRNTRTILDHEADVRRIIDDRNRVMESNHWELTQIQIAVGEKNAAISVLEDALGICQDSFSKCQREMATQEELAVHAINHVATETAKNCIIKCSDTVNFVANLASQMDDFQQK